MEELLTKIGELIAVELEEVCEVQYSREYNDIIIIVMNTGEKFKLAISALI